MRRYRQISSFGELQEFTREHGFQIIIIPWGENSGKPHQICHNEGDLDMAFEQALNDSIHESKVHVVFDSGFNFHNKQSKMVY
jgi:formate-dependent phosphoribosylglycinamide formyltransferase (GAR transformylase)